MNTPPITVSIDEAARLTGLKRRKLNSLIAPPELSTSKVGRRRLVKYQSLVDLLDRTSHEVGPA
jgi:excisionase family DNA binding protein